MSADKCAYPKCGKELTHVQGRKKKKYCNQNCNNRHWHSLHPSYKPKTKRVSLEDEKKFVQVPIEEYKMMMDKVKEAVNATGNVFPSKKDSDFAKNILDATKPTNVVEPQKPMGSEITNTVINTTPNPNQSLISQYEKELSTLGEGSFARARKKWLNNKINQLKSGTI